LNGLDRVPPELGDLHTGTVAIPLGPDRLELVDLSRVHVWHVENGRLTELWLHPVDQEAFDGYRGS